MLRLARRITGVVAAILLSAVVSELVLRTLQGLSPRVAYHLSSPWSRETVPDSALGFRLSPYAPGIDAWGFRNDSVPARADVVAIGDSFTYGFGAPRALSWPRQLAEITGLTVYNTGVGGFGPCEYNVVFDRILSLEPRVVVVGLHPGNDLSDAYRSVYTQHRCAQLASREADVIERLAAADNGATLSEMAETRGADAESTSDAVSDSRGVRDWIRDSRLYRLARSLRYELGVRRQSNAAQESEDSQYQESVSRTSNVGLSIPGLQRTVFKHPEALALTVDLSDPRIAEGMRIAEDVLVSMHRRMRDRGGGGRLLVAFILDKPAAFAPVVRSLDSSAVPPIVHTLASREQNVAEELRRRLDARGVEVLETVPVVRESLRAGKHPYPVSDDHHLNGEGYRLVAAAIAARLRDSSAAARR
jgi:hypothetical protein